MYEDDAPKHTTPRKRRRIIIMAAVVVVLVLLAVGLGVGLTVGAKNSPDEADAADQKDAVIENDGGGNPGTGPEDNGIPGDNSTKWMPGAGTTWQIVLRGSLEISSSDPRVAPSDVNAFDLDLFTHGAEKFGALHQLGKRVICYFSAGSYEPYRVDSGEFDKQDLGRVMDGWPDEKWLDIRSESVRKLMASRIRLASEKGCDAIDPDNVDGFQNDTGFDLTPDDAVDFMKFLHKEASKYNLAIGLKNAGDIIPDVVDFIDFSVNEQCDQYNECDTFAAFVEAGKPVFHIEYPDGAPGGVAAEAVVQICNAANEGTGDAKFSTVIKAMDLDGWVEYCNGEEQETALDVK